MPSPSPDSYLVLQAPGMDVLKVPLSRTWERVDGISVWEWSGSALDEGSEAANWFSTCLGKPARLVRFNAAPGTRAVDPEYTQSIWSINNGTYVSNNNTYKADIAPRLLMSLQGSINALNKLLPEPIPVNRIRPNIFVDGCVPFSEDLWIQLKINDLTFHGVKLCKMPTINQETGEFGPLPTETLMTTRSDRALRQRSKVDRSTLDKIWSAKSKTIKDGDPI